MQRLAMDRKNEIKNRLNPTNRTNRKTKEAKWKLKEVNWLNATSCQWKRSINKWNH